MSLRPNARTEVRRSRYKVSVDADEGRRRREDNMVEIRKNKREESLLKKRREGLQAHHQLSSSLNNSAAALDNKKLESLPAMVAGVWSDDRNAQLDATTQFRKLLSIERGPPINEVIQSGVVPRFIEFLSRDDFPQLQFEAAWAMTNIASGTSENTRVVIDHGAVPIFVRLLSSPTNDVREQAVRALGNVAGDSPKCRDLVLSNGALMPLLAQFNEHAKLSMLRNATWTLSNFCRGKPQPLFEQTKPALPILERLIHSNDDEVLTDACWALSYLSDGTNDKIQAVIEAGVCPRLVELLRHPSPSVLIPALRTVGNIVTGDDLQTQGGPDESINVNSNRTSNLPSSMQRPLMAPTVVRVSRPNEVENKRKDLPIVMMEQEIMEAVNDNSAVILCGETGCGKTTQVPQFIYEAGYGSNQCSIRSGTIGVTQPRRVAVLATAKRVAFELGLRLGKEVGFQVRHDKKIGNSCSIKFMTDGILLRELKYDVLLRQYSVIILDEAHERSLNTDILIGMLSRIIQPRQALYEKQQQLLLSGQCIEPKDRVFPLKLILMSATLRVEDFVSGGRLFHNPPIIEVPTRQFPVTVHFSKRTEIVDYIGQAYKKVMSIHKRLPQGGILVFVTGQREVEYLCRKLRKASKELVANSSNGNKWNEIISDTEPGTTEDVSMKEINEAFEIHGNSTDHQTDRFSSYDEDQFDIDDDESIASYDSETESETEILGEDEKSVDQKTPKDGGDHVDVLRENRSLASLKVAFEALSGKNASVSISQIKPSTGATLDRCTELPSTATPERCAELSCPNAENMGDNKRPCAGAFCVLPLYAMLPAAAQLCVFEDVKEGERLVVVATNVAETSLTIPGIKYVVDTGREKVKRYNSANGIESYEIQWISKASAAQRAGRAGRTAPGHCYRLYSSAVFNNILPDFSCAEISKVPVDGVVLLMKSMHIDKVANFPFPTPPEANALVEAERCLKALEALDSNGRLTTLGKAMAHYPMSPRHSRMLLTLIQIMEMRSYNRANLVLGYAVAAAAALSLSNPFVLQLEGTQTNSDDLEQERSNTLGGEDAVRRQEKLRKKKLKEIAKASSMKFSNPSSDVLTIAYALQCFELSKSPVEFCNEYGLHLKTMEEMSKLRKQLLHLIFNQNVNSDQGFSWTHGTLDDVEHSWRISSSKNILLQNEEELLCRAICAGWADRVAKRIRAKSGSLAGDRKVNAVRYQACMVKEDVFLHHRSSVANSAPEFLVYSELLHTKRPFMHGATRVKADWLVEYAQSLCHFSKSLEDSKYNYDCHKDQVLHWVSPIFGPHQWELPLHSLPVSRDDDQLVAVFACALLEGQVLPCLRYVQKFLAAHPSSILKTQESGQRRVGKLLNKLKTKSIDSCAMLKAAWQENPRALHSEILEWFQKGFHSKFEELWSQMLAEVQLESCQRFPKKQGG